MPCPEQLVIMEVAIPVLSVTLLLALVALAWEVRLSMAAWQARRQRQRALREALEVLQAGAARLIAEEHRTAARSLASSCGSDKCQVLTV
ncbi:hypothetical protein [Thermogemmatispora sp.]|uniref:hypothetical protein n=1 Tax=Thermogemmatispora sp. TaxID=1968838 RepID=UPI0035E446E5